MELTSWISILTICTLGAISPGPSIALIIRITASGGRWQGAIAAVAHGLGVGCYALLAATGLAIAIEQAPALFSTLKLLGAALLAYIGYRSLGLELWQGYNQKNNKAKPSSQAAESDHPALTGINSEHQLKTIGQSSNSFFIGFLTAILNPKVGLFFLALFSQFVRSDAGIIEKLIMAATAATIDTAWFLLVAVAVSSNSVANLFSGQGKRLEKVFGLLLIAVAIRVVFSE